MKIKSLFKINIFIIFLCVFIAVCCTFNIIRLSEKYPSATVIVGGLNEKVQWDGFEFTLKSGQIMDAETFFSTYPVEQSDEVGTDSFAERYAIFAVQIERLDGATTRNKFVPEYVGAERDAWYNLMAPNYFYALNPEWTSGSEMGPREIKTLEFVVGLHQEDFNKATWVNLEISQISLVLSAYPTKVELKAVPQNKK